MDAQLLFPLAILSALIGLAAAGVTARGVLRHSEGVELVRSTGLLIRQGAMAFLRREYSILAVFVVFVAVVIALLIDFNLTANARIAELTAHARERLGDGPWTTVAYVTGAFGSGLAGLIGMSIAVRGNTRTVTAAQIGLNPALRVAFSSGVVMGLSLIHI